jgi:hypothetical protein
MAYTVRVSARRVARSLRMRSMPVIAFSPIGGRPPDFVTGSFVTACRGRHRWTRPTSEAHGTHRVDLVFGLRAGQCSASPSPERYTAQRVRS